MSQPIIRINVRSIMSRNNNKPNVKIRTAVVTVMRGTLTHCYTLDDPIQTRNNSLILATVMNKLHPNVEDIDISPGNKWDNKNGGDANVTTRTGKNLCIDYKVNIKIIDP